MTLAALEGGVIFAAVCEILTHRSLAFDLRILVDTIKVVGLGRESGVRDRYRMGAGGLQYRDADHHGQGRPGEAVSLACAG